jgi:hypothetical protein
MLESLRGYEHLVVRDRDTRFAQLLRERLKPGEHGQL